MINPDHSQTDVYACVHVKVRIRDRIHILIDNFVTSSLVCSRIFPLKARTENAQTSLRYYAGWSEHFMYVHASVSFSCIVTLFLHLNSFH